MASGKCCELNFFGGVFAEGNLLFSGKKRPGVELEGDRDKGSKMALFWVWVK